MFKNTAAKFIVFAFDATTNVPKTGDAANLTAYVSKDYGAVTVLTDTSATEMDATNAPGYYLFDAAQAETNADCLLVTGKSATANIKVIGAPAVIYTRPTTGWLAPATAGRTLVVDAAGLADANMVKAGPSGSGTAQTAGDIIGDTNDIQSRLPAALSGGKMDSVVPDTQKVDVNTIKTQTITCAAGVTVLASVGTAATSTAQTGDNFARLGAPAGASVSADIAAVKAETASIQSDTNDIQTRVPAALTAGGNMKADALAISGSTVAADNLEESTEAIAYGTVDGTGATTTVFLSSALTPDSGVNDQFNGRVLIFKDDTTTANLRGQATTISDYAHTSSEVGTFTVVALTTAPQTGDTFVIL